MTCVQSIDAGRRNGNEVVVAVDFLGWRVEPVRQQGVSHITIGIAEVVDLEATHELLDVGLVGQEHGNSDDRAQARRHALGERQSGKRSRAKHLGDPTVDDGDGQI